MCGAEIPTRTKLEKLKKSARNSEWEKVQWKRRMEMKKTNEEIEIPKQKGIKQELIEENNAYGILSDEEDEDEDDQYMDDAYEIEISSDEDEEMLPEQRKVLAENTTTKENH